MYIKFVSFLMNKYGYKYINFQIILAYTYPNLYFYQNIWEKIASIYLWKP